MFINFSRLLDTHFIFNPMLQPIDSWIAKFLYIFFALLIILSFGGRLMAKKEMRSKNLPQKKMWQKIANFLATSGVIGLILLVVRQARAYFISMPFFFYLFVLLMIVWLFFILKWNFTKKKQMVAELKAKKEKEKYL